MSIIIRFAILGVASGALTALLALGIVISYRGSRVVNFAQGAVAMAGTYVFYDLHFTHHLPYAVSFAAGVAASGALGVATHLLVMRPLRNAPQVSRVIASLGVMAIVQQAVSHIVQPVPIYVPSSLPTSTVSVLGSEVGEDQLIITGIVLALAAGLGALYHYTQLGRATRAALDNRRAIAALGFSPDWVASLNWLIGGCLAGIAGILLAPITGLSVPTYTLLVLPALAAAVVGRMELLGLALLGGLAIGIIQSEMSYYVSAPGWSDAAPFLFVLVVLSVRGIGKVSRTTAAQRLPRVGTGVVRAQYVIPAFVVLVVITQIVHNQFWLGAVITSIGASIVLLSFVIITGYSGQLSLAQFAFAGLGAWFAGKLMVDAHLPLLLALIVGVLAVFPVGVLLGAVCLRTSGVNLSIATLGFAVAVEYLVFDSSSLTGASGIVIGDPHFFGLNISAVSHPSRYAVFALVVFFLAALATANLRRGVTGRRLLAARANERAAASLGINVIQAKVLAFGLASVIAALGGVVMGFSNSTIVFTVFSTIPSVQAVAQSVIGGLGWVGGSAIGGIGQVGGVFSQALEQWVGPDLASYVPLFLAVLLIVILIQQPDGGAAILSGQLRAVLRFLRLAPRSTVGTVPLTLAEQRSTGVERVTPSALDVEGLTVAFGGVVAVQDVSLTIHPGEVVGLIGPNGAGKTTVIDAISGYVRYRSGSVALGDRSLDGLAANARSRRGVTRSFQSLELFDDLSVLDNLMSASDPVDVSRYATDFFWPRRSELSSAAVAAIPEFGLTSYLADSPSDLPYGTRRLVAIARAAATSPSIILLDEPAAGLDDHETAELADLVQRLAREWGMGVLLVEHDVEMVMRTCDRIYALELGKVIAEGTPAEIRRNERVIESYLGAGTRASSPEEAGGTAAPARTTEAGKR